VQLTAARVKLLRPHEVLSSVMSQERLHRRAVAIKVLRIRDVQRLAQEAALLASFSNPAIVRYVAHGTTRAINSRSVRTA
jgi:hypothetical protein